MHIVFRESHGLDEVAVATDPRQGPAPLVVLSFSDSDLGAVARGWHDTPGLPAMRVLNLSTLRHPLSVDVYMETVLAHARAVMVRLIGGAGYWSYGLASLQDLARRRGIALAVLPADGRPDPALDAASTVPEAVRTRLARLMDQGGAQAAAVALSVLARAGGLAAPDLPDPRPLPEFGWYDPDRGPIAAWPKAEAPEVLVIFYRSHLTAADTAPADALIRALSRSGFAAMGAYVPSLKAPGVAAWLRAALAEAPVAAVVNATAFSARDAGDATPFDGIDAPVFQVALSTATRADWVQAARGLSPSDLAMNVVLPEVDGRLFAGCISFKAPHARDEALQFARRSHAPDAAQIDTAVSRIAAWHRLARTPAPARQLAVILSTYPGRSHQLAHAVGLDALASTDALLSDLAAEGYGTAPGAPLGPALMAETIAWPLPAYRAALETLPQALRDDLAAAWGAPEADPACRDGAFHFAATRRGTVLVALQPERGDVAARADDYHDLTRTPRHGYVALYLWLAAQAPHALIHMGAHGTLEWLPGKSVALSPACWPQALTGTLPVVYPFIVNDPGEAAQAKRRIGALTLGHLPPPLETAATPENLAELERLLDEYATAEGLDPARRDRLIAAIRAEAGARGLDADLGIPPGAGAAEAITRIDAFVCDLKESRFGDGLHVLGRGACGDAERAGMLAALAGRRVAPGPSGSPHRGRGDVLPTGRNLYAVDPRAVPTPVAHAQGVRNAEELLRRHLQDHGDWPRGLVVDLWGSATMRTGGEDFAMALHLAGLRPEWDAATGRVTGFEVVPTALLGRPRIDVTLRVSGLFRDIFPTLAQLFEAGAEALAARDEDAADNPYRSRAPRVFGPKPGLYGLGMAPLLDDFTPEARAAAGEAWLAASHWAIGRDGQSRPDRAGLEARVLAADAFVHAQDLAESDLLLAADYAVHEAGFAAAVARLGGAAPALYHLDTTRPDAVRARALPEEIARVVRARAANPAWAEGMMRHGFRGAAEIAATLDHMAAFAHLAGVVAPHLFDLYHDATLGRPEVADFLRCENPAALEAMQRTFAALRRSGLWLTRRNDLAALVEAVP